MKRSVLRIVGVLCLLLLLGAVVSSHAQAALGGEAYGWGDNHKGQLGAPAPLGDILAPARFGGASDIVSIATASCHTLALRSDGTVWACGGNDKGQLGIGSADNDAHPGLSQVAGLADVVAVAASGGSSYALKSDGTVWAWGDNTYGQLGDGTTVERDTPVLVSGLSGITAIAAGGGHSMALNSGGAVWAWGDNGKGQLGDGTTTDRHSPVPLSGFGGVVTAIACGYAHSVALKSDGTVITWGANGAGQLGDGTATDRLSPVQAAGLSGVTAVSAGHDHTAALKSDGKVMAWGANGSGQLGDGTTTGRGAPVQVAGLGGATAVSCGDYHTAALTSDGTVLAWGANGAGQLGDGGTTDSATAVQVNGLGVMVAVTAGSGVTLGKASPISIITDPSDGAVIRGADYTIKVKAMYPGHGDECASSVDVNVYRQDLGGYSWETCPDLTCANQWSNASYVWTLPVDGTYRVQSRAIFGNVTGYHGGNDITVIVDNSAPTSTITAPTEGAALRGASFVITGAATDGPGADISKVEVSVNGGAWLTATGTTSWSFVWTLPANGLYTIQSRATDAAGNVESPGPGVTVGVCDGCPDGDTDNDGLTDAEEITGCRNRLFGYHPTDPNDPDTDRGGVGDGVEVARGTDPNNPSDDLTSSQDLVWDYFLDNSDKQNTTFSFTNLDDAPAVVDLAFYNEDGTLSAAVPAAFLIQPGHVVRFSPADSYGVTKGSMEVRTTSSKVVGDAIRYNHNYLHDEVLNMGSGGNMWQPAGKSTKKIAAMFGDSDATGYRFRDYVNVKNWSDSPANITVNFYRNTDGLLHSVSLTLAGHEVTNLKPRDYVPDWTGGAIEVTSDAPVTASEYLERYNEADPNVYDESMYYPFESSGSTTSYLDVWTDTTQEGFRFIGYLYCYNPNDTPIDATFTLRDFNGNVVLTKAVTNILPHTKAVVRPSTQTPAPNVTGGTLVLTTTGGPHIGATFIQRYNYYGGPNVLDWGAIVANSQDTGTTTQYCGEYRDYQLPTDTERFLTYGYIFNPDPVKTVNATITYYKTDGSVFEVVNKTVAPMVRIGWRPFANHGAANDGYYKVTADNPFIGHSMGQTWDLSYPTTFTLDYGYTLPYWRQ